LYYSRSCYFYIININPFPEFAFVVDYCNQTSFLAKIAPCPCPFEILAEVLVQPLKKASKHCKNHVSIRDENFLGIPGNPGFSRDFWGFPEWVFPI
jgi:hypothetical protein